MAKTSRRRIASPSRRANRPVQAAGPRAAPTKGAGNSTLAAAVTSGATAGIEVAERLVDPANLPAVKAFLQRAVACPPAPVAPQPIAPTEDPRFVNVTGQIGNVAGQQKAHPPAKAKVAEAQGAAVGPPNETAAQAGAAQVDKMAAAKPGTFDKGAFIAAVGKAIDAASPKNLDEADKLKDSGKSAEVKQQVAGMVTKGKDDSAKDIKDATGAAPDASGAQPKAVAPMPPEQAGPPPPPVPGGNAMPAPRGPEETNLDSGPCAVNDKMADAKVSDEQLKKGNEPQFDKAVDSKQKVEDQAATAPAAVKAAEGQQLGQAQAGAAGTVVAGLDAMHGGRAGAVAGVGSHKDQAKAADEAKRAEVSKHIEDVFAKTKTEVNGVLDGLDQKVNDKFDGGEQDARKAFDANVGKDMDAWKEKRYSGITGAAQWLVDKVGGAPPEVDQIFARNRAAYLAQMEKVISDVADVVGGELGRAKQLIADGRAEVKSYVASQPASLRQFATEASDKITEQFDSLDSDVDSKQQSVVSDLANKYVAARKSVDDSISQMQADNKGLVDEAEEAVAGAVDVILKMKDMLLNVLSRAANAIDRIIADPMSFLNNLVNAVKAGLTKFVDNIGEHLKKGLIGWLLGALADAGIQIPETFDLKGILNLVLSILGLTWANIRGRIVSQIGEPVMAKIEQTVDVFKIIATEGLAGLWNWIVDRLGDFKEMVMGEIRSFITEKVIKAGVEWLIGVLNPAAAFIKACEAIYNVIMFFVEKGQAIMEFVNSILDSVESILNGGVGAVADLIEGTLAKTIPLIISFLADLLGLGGISDKIKEIIGKIQAPVNKAIDAVIGGALKIGRKMFAALMGKGKEKKAAQGDADSEAKHKIIASEAAAELEKPLTARDGETIEQARSDREEQARALETKYQPQIEPGTKMSITLGQASTDGDPKVPFNVVIAPNTTTLGGVAPLVAATHPANAGGKNFVVIVGGKFQLNPQYLGTKKFRMSMYGGSFRKSAGELAGLYFDLLHGVAQEDPVWRQVKIADRATSWACPGADRNSAHIANIATSVGIMTLDHEIEVARHWNSSGHNMTQEARRDFYSQIDNLGPMCKSCNSSRSGPSVVPDVGPDFRGP